MPMNQACPCQSGKHYADCCSLYHQGQPAPTAEALMRSRYSAYALRLADYLNATWHPDTLDSPITTKGLTGIEWIGLTIHDSQTVDQSHATVKFTAMFDQGDGRQMQMTENSRFVCKEGQWLYLDGTHD